ncbi:MAG: ATP-binding cassette domain-containing protein [Candidatus Limnocylindrales bacterium]
MRSATPRSASSSGGERNRVQLARLLRRGGNLLVLDEPTNDLDLPTLGALEDGLIHFGGCALIVSHDRWFLDRVATAILAFEGDGVVTLYEGSYSFYAERRPKPIAAPTKREARDVRDRAKPVLARKLSFKEARELEGIEDTIAAAEAERDRRSRRRCQIRPCSRIDRPKVQVLISALDTARLEVERPVRALARARRDPQDLITGMRVSAPAACRVASSWRSSAASACC